MSTIYLFHKNNPQQSVPLQVIPTYAFPGFSSPSLLQFSSYLPATFTHPIPRLGIANCRSLPPPAPCRESKTHFSLCDFHVFTEKLLRFFPRLWLYCPQIEIMRPKQGNMRWAWLTLRLRPCDAVPQKPGTENQGETNEISNNFSLDTEESRNR